MAVLAAQPPPHRELLALRKALRKALLRKPCCATAACGWRAAGRAAHGPMVPPSV